MKKKLRNLEMPRKQEEMDMEEDLSLEDMDLEGEEDLMAEEDDMMAEDSEPSMLEDISDEELLDEVKKRGLALEESEEVDEEDMELSDTEDDLEA